MRVNTVSWRVVLAALYWLASRRRNGRELYAETLKCQNGTDPGVSPKSLVVLCKLLTKF